MTVDLIDLEIYINLCDLFPFQVLEILRYDGMMLSVHTTSIFTYLICRSNTDLVLHRYCILIEAVPSPKSNKQNPTAFTITVLTSELCLL